MRRTLGQTQDQGFNEVDSKDTEAVVLVLDRVNHTLARKVRTEASRRGLPIFFQKRGRQVRAAGDRPLDLMHWLGRKECDPPETNLYTEARG